MYTLVRSIGFKQVLLEQVPVLVTSLVIAEIFYKFHSFTLECLAFLGTWYVLDLSIQFARRHLKQ
ncbi:MAG: hypothetical protein HW396_449 [Candidatus Dadabacteria bacterium]|jgi:hypothetical protein|nr:hypothetical protein [Candidatus Dadabacteria bacterium]